MIPTIIQARKGERILVENQSKRLVDRMNERLNAIAAEGDDEHTVEASA